MVANSSEEKGIDTILKPGSNHKSAQHETHSYPAGPQTSPTYLYHCIPVTPILGDQLPDNVTKPISCCNKDTCPASLGEHKWTSNNEHYNIIHRQGQCLQWIHAHASMHAHSMHTHLIHYMRIHVVPVHQLLHHLELAMKAGQKKAVCVTL